jgi:hypothetical protein
MKKVLVVSVLVLVGASIAFASSMSVPFFADNAVVNGGTPPPAGQVALVYLKSNVPDVVTCEIIYYNSAGRELGPYPPNNTFTIQPFSGLAFRPVMMDPDGETTYVDPISGTTVGPYPAGFEGAQGVAVPDRPRSVDTSTPIPGTDPPLIDTKKNGACTISWVGGPTDIQGYAATIHSAGYGFGYLLPPGS